MINGTKLNTEKWSTVRDWILWHDQWCKIGSSEKSGGARSESKKWAQMQVFDLAPLIISQFWILHCWWFLSAQYFTVNYFLVFNLALLIIYQYLIWHCWTLLSIQFGTVDQFSVFTLAPSLISQCSIWHRWLLLGHKKPECLIFGGYFEVGFENVFLKVLSIIINRLRNTRYIVFVRSLEVTNSIHACFLW